MSKGLEKIVAGLELCKLIPAGEFEDTALVWRYDRICGFICLMSGYPDESARLRNDGMIYPAPTAEEIRQELRNLSVNVIDGAITVSCRIDPEETLYEAAGDDNDVTSAALRLWLRVKEIEVKS